MVVVAICGWPTDRPTDCVPTSKCYLFIYGHYVEIMKTRKIYFGLMICCVKKLCEQNTSASVTEGYFGRPSTISPWHTDLLRLTNAEWKYTLMITVWRSMIVISVLLFFIGVWVTPTVELCRYGPTNAARSKRTNIIGNCCNYILNFHSSRLVGLVSL